MIRLLNDQLLLGHLLQTGVHLAKSLNLADAGYRFIMKLQCRWGPNRFPTSISTFWADAT